MDLHNKSILKISKQDCIAYVLNKFLEHFLKLFQKKTPKSKGNSHNKKK